MISSSAIETGRLDEALGQLYGLEEQGRQRIRYALIADSYAATFGADPSSFFSSPGRTELGGNHTDHNNGRVLAAAVHLDKVAAATATDDMRVRMTTEAFDEEVVVDLRNLEARESERGSSAGLLRGIAAYLKQAGYRIGGWNAYVQSKVAMGSGLSSSAAVEMLITEIFSSLYNDGGIGTVEKAIAGQRAENHYFGKPCGLMDQLACAHGGIVALDFAQPGAPKLSPVDYYFTDHGYSLCILDTGSSHADLTDDYASIPREMGCVAEYLGAETLRGVPVSKLHARLGEVRTHCGDRALLRALHFYSEHDRAGAMAGALERGETENYLELVRSSASSSWRFLQNCIPSHGREQGLALALGLSEELLGESGAIRVHGGGFAGTAQVYVAKDRLETYRRHIEGVFGRGALQELAVRPQGVVSLK